MWNGWWCMVVTMTTVGFGDFFAVTYMGRVVSIVACFCGVFLVSLTMVTLDQSKNMSPQEEHSYSNINSYTHFKILKEKAALWIFRRFKVHKFDKMFLSRDPFNPDLFLRRASLLFDLTEARKEFMYAQKMRSSLTLTIMLIEEIESKVDKCMNNLNKGNDCKNKAHERLELIIKSQ